MTVVRNITGRTKLLGLIGDPVAQARSPSMANSRLAETGEFGDFIFVPFHVGANDLVSFVQGLRSMQNFAGAIVTMPHKQNIVHLLNRVSDEVKCAGACNVLRRKPDGTLEGGLFDGEGFVAGLRSKGLMVHNKDCLLAGAGGAAAAIAYALAKTGCRSITILNRTPSKAEALASRIKQYFPQLDIGHEVALAKYDMAINATSLGMNEGDPLPIPLPILKNCELVADCVISPEMTPLLRAAQGAGLRTHSGVPMLAEQMNLLLQFMTRYG